jgi:hypothetical protein
MSRGAVVPGATATIHSPALGKKGQIEILTDILNAFNDTAEVSLVTNNFFSPSFQDPSAFVDPLRAMIGVKLSF